MITSFFQNGIISESWMDFIKHLIYFVLFLFYLYKKKQESNVQTLVKIHLDISNAKDVNHT